MTARPDAMPGQGLATASGDGTDAPILVPTGSAAAALAAATDHAWLASGESVWPAPTAGALRPWIIDQATAVGYQAPWLDDADFVLSGDQEMMTWREVIADDPDGARIGAEQAAAMASAAWRMQHEFNIDARDAARYSGDVAAYLRWVEAWRAHCRDLRAISMVEALASWAATPQARAARARGFVQPTPLEQHLLAGLGANVLTPERGEPSSFRPHAFAAPEDELIAALSFAGETTAGDAAARVAVVVDGLPRESERVARALAEVFGAAGATEGRYFLGASRALVGDPALRLLQLACEFDDVQRWDHWSEFSRHPLLPGAAAERAARAAFDVRLRDSERYDLPLAWVVEQLEKDGSCPHLLELVGTLLRVVRGARGPLSRAQWVQHFDQRLQTIGWPHGEMAGTPADPRLLAAWHEVRDRATALDAVGQPCSLGEARALVRRLFNNTSARRVAPRSGVFVVTPEDAIVIAPTHVWLVGCHDRALLPATGMTPLLPLEAQRSAGVPGADPAQDLWRARVLIESLAGGATVCDASYAVADGDEVRRPSSLLPRLASAAVTASAAFVPYDWRLPAASAATIDDPAPAVPAATGHRRGINILADQAACGFRALAHHRLAATVAPDPRPGVSARKKGIAVHGALEIIWAELGDQASLAATSDEALDALIERAVRDAWRAPERETELEREIFFVERRRLQRLVRRWLEFEKSRPPFAVEAREADMRVAVGDLGFTSRPDRIDQLEDGGRVIVDYKTGRNDSSDWVVPRLRGPQLPVYATLGGADNTGAITSIAYACVRADGNKWVAFPGKRRNPAELWAERSAAWREDLEQSAAAYLAGDAAADPRDGNQTCSTCDCALLCRRAAFDGDDDAGEEAAE